MPKRPGLLLPLYFAVSALAHPLGNFSINHYTKIMPQRTTVGITYVLDLAEKPTFDLLREWKLDAGSPRAELEMKAEQQVHSWMRNLTFSANGTPVMPALEHTGVTINDGAAQMKVMRITAQLRLSTTHGELYFEDHNYPDTGGWKEIVIAAGDGVDINLASQTSQDRSNALTSYPSDTAKPPQDLRASLHWGLIGTGNSGRTIIRPIPQPQTEASEPVQPKEAPAAKADYLSTLLSNRQLSLWMMITGLAAAFALGAVHAFSPGHGKTMVAAYLVGSRGTAAHAVLLGAMVTITHTMSVFVLGLVTLFLTQYIVPEKLVKILELISGISIVVIGAWLLTKRVRAMRVHSHTHSHHDHHQHDHHQHDHHQHDHHQHDHAHPHSHQHHHDDHPHHHHDGPGGHTHTIDGEVSVASLIALGASGGLVPCPSALVLMLSAIAVGRIAFGLTLLVAFSLGLAVVLTSIGVMVVYARHLLPDSKKAATHPAFRLIPVLSAAVIVCIGLVMTGVAIGWISPKLTI